MKFKKRQNTLKNEIYLKRSRYNRPKENFKTLIKLLKKREKKMKILVY